MLNFAEIVLKKDATIIQALVAIDRGSCKTAFVADSDGKLAAAVTDGDIRRALIRGAELSAPIEGVANSSPISVNQDYRCARVRELMQANLMNAVPVVDGRGRIIDVLRLNYLVVEANQTPVVIMAGGLGRRLGALVEDIPKPMLKVAGEPILQHIIGNLTRFGFANIFLSINYKSNVIENYFGDGSNFGCNIQYIRESKRLGTGGSIRLCEGLIRTDFLVINGDILTKANLMKMLRFHVDNRFDMTVGTVNHTVNVDYGVLEVEGDTIRA
ncbi:MAG: NTP transferase domain-containing protein, partial [Clostridiales bacterium]|nr:NTP transferase domain-containing protein [Clostridiales bacterium]